MSKFWIYLKANIRADLKQGHILIGTFVLMPLFFSLLMGYSFNPAFTPEVSLSAITIHLENNDKGEFGSALKEFLNSDELNEIVEVTTAEEADFNILIKPEYSQQLEETNIMIKAADNSSSTEQQILKQLLTTYQKLLVEQLQLAETVSTIEDSNKAQMLLSSLGDIGSISRDSIFQVETYVSDQALTSQQFSSVAGLIYMLLFTLAGTVTMNTEEKFKGTRKRLEVVPLSTSQKVLYEILTNVTIYTILGLIYIATWRIIDRNTFSGNILFYIGWLLLYTLLFQAINMALKYIVSDKASYILYQLITMVYMIFGFLPVERMVGGALGDFFNRNVVRELFNQPIYDYILGDNLAMIFPLFISIFLVSVVFISVTIFIKDRRDVRAI